MSLLHALILLSSLSFLGYGISYFKSTNMKLEFKRFGLEKFGAPTAILEVLGGAGLLVGIKYNPILLVAAGGLSLLMLLGVIVRIKLKDSIWITLPAFIFMALNGTIFFISLSN
ncbi:MAG: DoxX family protein [Bacteroidia bacterium]|nr:DoxX family protein [Bacteroidia bacterium]